MSETVKHSTDHKREKTVRLGPRSITIPEVWDVVPFEDAIELNPTYTKPDEGPFDFLPMDAVDEKNQTIEYWTEREKDDCTTTWFKNGDTLYPKITPCTENGKIAFVEGLSTEVGSGSTEFLVFHPREGITDERFVYYLSNLPDFRSVTISLMEGSTGRQRVPSDVFEKGIEIPLPPLPEQRCIADILSKVDEQIQQTDEMIQSLRDLKDGLSQDVFDVQTTKGDPDDETEKEILGDFVEVISGTHVKSDLVSADKSKTPYITGPDDFENRGFQVTKYTDDPPSFCEPEDTLVTVKGSGCGASTFANQRAGISRQLKALRPTEQLDSSYLYYWIQTKEELLSILAQGTSIPGLSTTDLTTLQIPLPPLERQEYMGEMFSTVDSRLDEEREQKQHLQELKRGLMQDLLTGTKRVVPETTD